jgi:4-amino-4-deoxy-L-arabinose transferase-like glycosyltransferase
VVLGGVVLTVGLVHWIGYDRFPGRINDDEGTYVTQAYALESWHTLAHYTYWYDHPPAGWITIAGYTWVTRAFGRLPTAVSAGREFMVWVKLLTAALLYLLARRLSFHRAAAAGAVLAFGLSPLALPLQRMALLDNLAVMWTLAALALAASPKRSLAASAGSAVCFAIAVLSKETIVVVFPALLVLLWQHTSATTRSYRMALFLALFAMVVFFYPLYAILKNELFEGAGHVSLIWAVKWQLFDRRPTGSVLDPHSQTHQLARSWLRQDPWLLGSATLLTPIGLLSRRVRAAALALAIQLLVICRNGYTPWPYVLGMVPFAALVVAGATDQLCKSDPTGWIRRRRWQRFGEHRVFDGVAKLTGQAVVVLTVVGSLVVATPGWAHGLYRELTEDRSLPPRQTVAYVLAYVPRGSVMLVDDNLWTDLVRHGFTPRPIWFYKADLDPAVRGTLPDGWRDIDYVVLPDFPSSTLADLPLVAAAIRHSRVVAQFGSGDGALRVRRVDQEAPD